jgi:hypothetical protein
MLVRIDSQGIVTQHLTPQLMAARASLAARQSPQAGILVRPYIFADMQHDNCAAFDDFLLHTQRVTGCVILQGEPTCTDTIRP